MPYTDADKVRTIVETDDEAFPDLGPFIAAANSLVGAVCLGSGYSDFTLELIERWLAAHFYAVSDPRSTYEQAGSVSEKLEGKTDLGLDFTRYGQQAKLLDYAGNLAKLGRDQVGKYARVAMEMVWLGTDDGSVPDADNPEDA